MVKIIWTEIAIEDLKIIYSYISRDSKKYAEKLTNKIIERIEQLENFPNSGRIVPEFNNIQIRELIEGNIRIVYFYQTIIIAILRIHHSSQLLNK